MSLPPLEGLPADLPEPELAARLPQGFRVGGRHAGIKPSGGRDLGVVIVVGEPAAVAATFTSNRLPAAPVQLDQEHLAATDPDGGGRRGWVAAMLATSGCANAATGAAGLDDQRRLAASLAAAAQCSSDQVLAMSTGLIGTRLPVDRLSREVASMVAAGLGDDDGSFGDVADALRTTDSRSKAASVRLRLPRADGTAVPVTVSGVAKGVGMIHPNMATMLCFVLTDAAADPATLHGLLRPIVARTWDQISVDGDQSTNDTVLLAASGASGAASLVPGSGAAAEFGAAVEAVARSLARQQAADGEGANTLISCAVSGASDDADARAVAREVIGSSLVKAAIYGADPNWGRMAAAIGNAVVAPAEVLIAAGLDAVTAERRAGQAVLLDADRLRIDIEGVPVFAGAPLAFDASSLSERLRAAEVSIRIDLGLGDGTGEAFGCDLTERYVIENSEYST